MKHRHLLPVLLLTACAATLPPQPPVVEIPIAAAARTTSRSNYLDPRIHLVSTGVYEIEAPLFEALISTPHQVAPQVWVEPLEEAGELTGYRLHGITPGSLLSQLGLMSDDVIELVNGERLRTEASTQAAHAAARRLAQVTIVLDRNGFQKLMLYRLIYRGNRSMEGGW